MGRPNQQKALRVRVHELEEQLSDARCRSANLETTLVRVRAERDAFAVSLIAAVLVAILWSALA